MNGLHSYMNTPYVYEKNVMGYLYFYCDLTALGGTIYSKVMNYYGDVRNTAYLKTT